MSKPISVGDKLVSKTFPRISRHTLALYFGASGDHNPIHVDLDFAKQFADAVHKVHPGKMLAYNCSPSFNWKKNLDDATIAKFQRELGAMGYKFQFITLALSLIHI